MRSQTSASVLGGSDAVFMAQILSSLSGARRQENGGMRSRNSCPMRGGVRSVRSWRQLSPSVALQLRMQLPIIVDEHVDATGVAKSEPGSPPSADLVESVAVVPEKRF